MIGYLPRPQALALQAIGRFRCLMHPQITRMFYAPTSKNYAKEAVHDLTEAGYTQMVLLPRASKGGSSPGVWFLDDKGRRLLKGEGLEVGDRIHHGPPETALFLQHALDANEAVIAFIELGRHNPHVTVTAFWSEAEIRRWKLPVAPDGWVELSLRGKPFYPWIELDRGTEPSWKWKEKVKNIVGFYTAGKYQSVFGTDRLSVVVFAPEEKRRNDLARWTIEELGDSRWKDYFLFTSASPTTSAMELFFHADWARTTGELRPLFRGGEG